MHKVHTNCRICGQRCGLIVTVDGNRVIKIGPDKENPLSWRDFCVKGRTAAEMVEHPRRIVAPMRRVGDRYVEATYEDAFVEIAETLRGIIERDRPEAVACYYGNPAGFNPSALPALMRFMRALGSENVFNWNSVDTNAKAVTNGEMYGATQLPLIPDVDDCDCFLFVGANPAESKMVWITTVPNGWKRILARVNSGAELMVLDPYRTATADAATEHWQILPGEDWAFLLGMLKVIFDNGLEDRAACEAEDGIEELRRLAADADLDQLAARAGLPRSAIETAALKFGRARTAMAIARTGVSQTSRGTLAVWLSEVLTIVTGNWDRPGGRYFQPGYTKPLVIPYHPNPHLSRVAGRPAIEGCHALAELPDEILTPGPGQVRALFIDHGNPVISGPQGAVLDEALANLELLVAVDLVQRESHRHAHWLIPGRHWLERSELAPHINYTQELPFAQYAAQAVQPPPKVRAEWEFYLGVGQALGLPGYGPDDRPYNPEASWRRAVDRSGRISWDEIVAHPHGILLGEREFGHARAALLTPEQRIRLAPPRFVAEARRQLASAPADPPPQFPLRLGNRRRNSSMNSFLNELPGTRRLVDRNQVEINHSDAQRLNLKSGDRARVSSDTGSIELEVSVTDAPRPGVVVVEHGWGSRIFDPAGESAPDVLGANRNLLTVRTAEDPLSLMTAFNETWVAVEPIGGDK